MGSDIGRFLEWLNRVDRKVFGALDELDERVVLRPARKVKAAVLKPAKKVKTALEDIDRAVLKPVREVRDALKKVDDAVFLGAGRIHPMKRKGSAVGDFAEWVRFHFVRFMEGVDTKVLFHGRGVVSPAGRFRSKSERKIAEFLMSCGIKFIYEDPIVLEGIKLHPDFYLPSDKVYIEFWGMADFDASYRMMMGKKLRLYRKHNVRLISIYPGEMGSLKKVLAKRYEKITGKVFPSAAQLV